MSKTRWDRNRAARATKWEGQYTPFTGGLDQASSALNIKPGRIVQSINVEELFGQQGYNFVRGYERFDGQRRPSQADYWLQIFKAGSSVLVQGQVITNGGAASATVVQVTVSSGSFAGGDALGFLLLTDVVGAWADGDPIQVGGLTHATAADTTEEGSVSYPDNQTALTTVRDYLRGFIQKPPGSGGILGGAVFNGVVYCARNAADGLTANIWKSSASGWQSIAGGLHPGGAYKFVAANFSGATDDLSLYFVSGRTRVGKITRADAISLAGPIWGSEALSSSAVTIGTGAKTFTSATASRDWQVGDELTVWYTGSRAYFMAGTVTGYNSGTGQLDMNVTSVSGAGTFNTWEIGRTDFSDKPFLLREHKNHMFYAYPQGQLQTSNLGDAMACTSTAALFGCGQDIVELVSLKGKALGIFCSEKIEVLDGASAADWSKGIYSPNMGSISETVQENGGNALFLNRLGLSTLQAVQAFGNFENSTFSRDVEKLLDVYRNRVVASRMARNNYQYRLYFDDGYNLRFTFLSSNPTPGRRDVSPALSQYNHTATCVFSGVMDDGLDRMFFGTEDGYVMEEDVGTSFDGEAIYYALLLSYDHFKSPAVDKQFHKLELELSCPDPLSIYFKQLFDYDDGTFAFGTGQGDSPGEGGRFDLGTLDNIYFDLPGTIRLESSIDGEGRNMALLLWAESDFVRPAALQGVMTFFSYLGVRP